VHAAGFAAAAPLVWIVVVGALVGAGGAARPAAPPVAALVVGVAAAAAVLAAENRAARADGWAAAPFGRAEAAWGGRVGSADVLVGTVTSPPVGPPLAVAAALPAHVAACRAAAAGHVDAAAGRGSAAVASALPALVAAPCCYCAAAALPALVAAPCCYCAAADLPALVPAPCCCCCCAAALLAASGADLQNATAGRLEGEQQLQHELHACVPELWPFGVRSVLGTRCLWAEKYRGHCHHSCWWCVACLCVCVCMCKCVNV